MSLVIWFLFETFSFHGYYSVWLKPGLLEQHFDDRMRLIIIGKLVSRLV